MPSCPTRTRFRHQPGASHHGGPPEDHRWPRQRVRLGWVAGLIAHGTWFAGLPGEGAVAYAAGMLATDWIGNAGILGLPQDTPTSRTFGPRAAHLGCAELHRRPA